MSKFVNICVIIGYIKCLWRLRMNNHEFMEKISKMSLEQLSEDIITKKGDLSKNEVELFNSGKNMIDKLFECWKHNEPTERAGRLVYEYLAYKFIGGK